MRISHGMPDGAGSLDRIGDGLDLREPNFELLVGETDVFPDVTVARGTPQLVNEPRREHQLERAVRETIKDPTGRPAWSDERAQQDVRVEDGADHRLLPTPLLFAVPLAALFARPALRLESEIHGFLVGESVARPLLLSLEELLEPLPGGPPHLFQALDRHERGQRLTFPLDDELVVPERDAIEHVAKALPYVERRNLLGHEIPYATMIVA